MSTDDLSAPPSRDADLDPLVKFLLARLDDDETAARGHMRYASAGRPRRRRGHLGGRRAQPHHLEARRDGRDLLDQIGQHRSRGVIIDVAALDVIDSFACHTLRTITEVSRLRGAETVVVGIQPDVALAMVRLGVSVEALATALDLEEGMALLEVITSGAVFLPGKGAR